MLGRKERDQLELFITGSLRQLVPDDHILPRVDRVLDLSWLRDEVADRNCAENGRPMAEIMKPNPFYPGRPRHGMPRPFQIRTMPSFLLPQR